jgi:putative transposase
MVMEDSIKSAPEFQKMLDIVNEFDPPKYKRKLSNENALLDIIHVLRTGLQWRQLRPRVDVSPLTVQGRFSDWVNLGVFDAIWERLLEDYSKKRLNQSRKWFKNIFIDSSLVKNVYWREISGRNPTDRGRAGTKVSIVCDKKMVPLGCTFYPANLHDSQTTLQSFDSIRCPVKKDNRSQNRLVGDNGYDCLATKYILQSVGVDLLTPKRSNAATKPVLTLSEKVALHDRHVIENTFCRLDKFKRLFTRYDRSISSFSSWHYLAFGIMISEANKPSNCRSKRRLKYES